MRDGSCGSEITGRGKYTAALFAYRGLEGLINSVIVSVAATIADWRRVRRERGGAMDAAPLIDSICSIFRMVYE